MVGLMDINLQERKLFARAPAYVAACDALEKIDERDTIKRGLAPSAGARHRVAILRQVGLTRKDLALASGATEESVRNWMYGNTNPAPEFSRALLQVGLVLSKLIFKNELEPGAALDLLKQPHDNLGGLTLLESLRTESQEVYDHLDTVADSRI
jgi:transcriptional regulator with XRE-family HTH domain